jgi:kumamolisin
MPDENRAYVALAGSDRQIVPGAQEIGPADPAEVIQITIRLRSRGSMDDKAAQVAALGAQLPGQRTYMTEAEFEATYGADPAAIEKVTAFAHAQGLTVVSADAVQREIILSGTNQAFSTAFKIQLVRYSSPQGEYRGRLGPIQMPADLAPLVDGVFGLDNRMQARPHIIHPRSPRRPEIANASGVALKTAAQSFTSPQVAQLYNFPAGLTGKGQTIGLIEFGGGFAQSDLDAYFKQLNLPTPNVTAVSVDGTQNAPGQDTNADGEVLLDIEVAAGVAPDAKIVVYFAPFTEQGWVDVINTAVHDTTNKPSVLSISWGYTEGQDIWTSQAIQAVNQVFQSAALLGVTVCAASGDDGSRDQLDDGHAHVDFPAASPYVLACGGTSLQVSGATLQGETVWNNGPVENAGGGASGGGIAEMNALPDWQKGIVPPSINPGAPTGRGVPDVAGNADENSGYTILADGQEVQGVGGTSAVSPLFAGLFARINQQLGKPVGYINPLLYSTIGKSGVFRDVTSGNNDPTGSIGGYSAKAGWDACTGWGSPDGVKLLNALTGAPAVPVPTPAPSGNPPAPAGNAPAPSSGSPSTSGSGTSAADSGSGPSAGGLIGALLLILVVAAVVVFLLINNGTL